MMFAKTTRLLLIFAAATLLIGLPRAAHAAAEKGPRCSDGIDNDGDGKIDCVSGNEDPDCKCSGGGGGGGGGSADLQVTYDFDGVITTVNACAVDVVCDQNDCQFEKEVPVFKFRVAPSYDTLVENAEWRGTPLDGDLCFQLDGGTDLELYATKIRVGHDFGQRWIAAVSGIACDLTKAGTLDTCDRDYQFRFDAPCPPGDCDPIPQAAGDANAEYVGDLLATWSSGPDQKKGIPCRCTMSNTPGCPNEVAEMTAGVVIPPIEITVAVAPAGVCP